MYPKVQMFIAGEWCDGTSGKTEDVVNPATGQPIGKASHASRRPRPRAGGRPERLRGLAQGLGRTSARKLMRKAAGLMRERAADDRPRADAGAGQAVRRGEGRDAGRRRHHRLVRRGRPPRLWPHRAVARRGRAPARDQGAGRPGRRVHALEFPDQPGRCASSRRALAAGCSIIVKAPEETPASPRGAGAGLRRRRRAGRRASAWCSACPAEISELPDPAPDHPQGHLHRLDRRSASSSPRSPAST